jgi:hypothetical protein
MTRGTNESNETLQVRSRSVADPIGTKIRLTANQGRATGGLLEWALDASDRRHDDQEWFIARPVGLVLDLDSEPNNAQYDSAITIIGSLAAELAPSRAAITFSVDEHLLLAALLDQAFYLDDVHDRQQWPIEAAAAALYPNLDDAPKAVQYDRAYRLLRETRARLEPLPERPEVRVGDCLLACDLEELEENECGYQVVAVDAAAVTVRHADGADHEVSRAAIAAREACVVRYFGDFETQPDDPGYQERRQRENEEWTRRIAQIEKERRARAFAELHQQPHNELRDIDARIADSERLIARFRSGATESGNVERSVGKQQTKIAKLESARANTLERIAVKSAKLRDTGDPRHAAVVAWQSAADAIAPIAHKRNAALAEIDARFVRARATGEPDADVVHHRDRQATITCYQEQIEAASAHAKAAFEQLVTLC